MGILVVIVQRKLVPLPILVCQTSCPTSGTLLLQYFLEHSGFSNVLETVYKTHSKLPGAQHISLWCLSFW